MTTILLSKSGSTQSGPFPPHPSSSRFFRDATFRERLLGATDLETIFRTIEEEDAKF